jgi:hypothetical protein
MKFIKETKDYYLYHDDVWGYMRLYKWNSFLREKEILDKIGQHDENEIDVNDEEVQSGYEELYSRFIGAPN